MPLPCHKKPIAWPEEMTVVRSDDHVLLEVSSVLSRLHVAIISNPFVHSHYIVIQARPQEIFSGVHRRRGRDSHLQARSSRHTLGKQYTRLRSRNRSARPPEHPRRHRRPIASERSQSALLGPQRARQGLHRPCRGASRRTPDGVTANGRARQSQFLFARRRDLVWALPRGG